MESRPFDVRLGGCQVGSWAARWALVLARPQLSASEDRFRRDERLV
jgi:hypothetical protein